jgi:hypothetical protein
MEINTATANNHSAFQPRSTDAEVWLAGEIMLPDPETGRLVAVRDIASGHSGCVATLDEYEAEILGAEPSDYLFGASQLFRVVTESGRQIEAAGGVQLRTFDDGWKPITHLKRGDSVMMLSYAPALFGTKSPRDATVKQASYLLAEKHSDDPACVLRTSEVDIAQDFERAIGRSLFGLERIKRHGNPGPYYDVHCEKGAFWDVIGPSYRSRDRAIPDFIFESREAKVGLFLNRLFTMDGDAACERIMLWSQSLRLLSQVQHLLARYGIVATLEDPFLRESIEGRPGQLSITSGPSVRRFLDAVGVFGDASDEANETYESLTQKKVPAREPFEDPVAPEEVVSVQPTRIAPVYGIRIKGTGYLIANDFVMNAKARE